MKLIRIKKQYALGLLSLICIVFSSKVSLGQSVKPGNINLTGGSISIASNVYEWSIGEMVLVETMIADQLITTNGLLQSYRLVPPAFALVPNNFLSPNGDGENDVWIVDQLTEFPDNEVFVYDHAGRVVFNAKNYQNNWNGKVNGQVLAEDSYYFVIQLKKGNTTGVIKGFITIIQ